MTKINHVITKYGRKKIPIYCITKKKVYESVYDAAKDLKVSHTCIYRIAKGEQESVKNLTFRYLYEDEIIKYQNAIDKTDINEKINFENAGIEFNINDIFEKIKKDVEIKFQDAIKKTTENAKIDFKNKDKDKKFDINDLNYIEKLKLKIRQLEEKNKILEKQILKHTKNKLHTSDKEHPKIIKELDYNGMRYD